LRCLEVGVREEGERRNWDTPQGHGRGWEEDQSLKAHDPQKFNGKRGNAHHSPSHAGKQTSSLREQAIVAIKLVTFKPFPLLKI
jgi:hypothetical protein